MRTLDELDVATWHEMFDSNLHCTFYLCRAAVPLMRSAGRGRIINLGFAGSEQLKARPSIAPYAIAKTGVILYSKALAKTVARDGITVNVVSPGVMENSVAQPVSEIPLGRTGTLLELSSAVLYLASDEAAYSARLSSSTGRTPAASRTCSHVPTARTASETSARSGSTPASASCAWTAGSWTTATPPGCPRC